MMPGWLSVHPTSENGPSGPISTSPIGFLGCILGSLLSKEEGKAEVYFDELYVRSETGLGAEEVEEEAAAPRRPGRAPASAM